MTVVPVSGYEQWRERARNFLSANAAPHEIIWRDGGDLQESLNELFDLAATATTAKGAPRVPKQFLDLAQAVACFRDPERWGLMYRVLFRLTHGEPNLLHLEIDDDVRRMMLMSKAVGRDIHKMTAFVRFRKIERKGGEEFVAWHRPDHLIVERAAPFFARRFGSMRWAILTPDRSVYFDLRELRFGPGVSKSEGPQSDELEELWRTYYASIFNPARVKVKAMKAEMPVRHWATLPEAQLIPELLAQAGARTSRMAKEQPPSARLFIPAGASIDELRIAAAGCRACSLCEHATQTVFGEGPAGARVAFVGEQPGDSEDLQGRPFVGPAGQLLDRALRDVGIERSQLYLTNAVKHFKFERDGKRRIHQKPRGVEVAACHPWLEAELKALRPELLVCLGATAAQSLAGKDFQISRNRGIFYPHPQAGALIATIHPSAILRIPDPARQQTEYEHFVADLRLVKQRMSESR